MNISKVLETIFANGTKFIKENTCNELNIQDGFWWFFDIRYQHMLYPRINFLAVWVVLSFTMENNVQQNKEHGRSLKLDNN